MSALFRRVAGVLGWTPGQAWTVAVGLVVAVPAALLGLGPTLNALRHSALAVAAPPAAAAAPLHTEPPAILGAAPPAPAGRPASSGRTSSAVNGAPEPGRPTSAAPAVTPPNDAVFATLSGTGTVRSLAVAADAVVVAVDDGGGAPGRVVVLDSTGAVAREATLVVNNVPYQQPGGVTVTTDGVLVTTTSPAAVLRVDAKSGAVSKVADIPDLPLCLPVVRATNCQPSVPDTAPRPQQLAASDDGAIYVADRGQACVFQVASDSSKADPWLCDLSFAASPSANGNGGLAGLAVAGDRVVFTVAEALDGNDSVQEVTVQDGAPANRHSLAAPPSHSGVGGVTILDDGRAVAALTVANALFVVGADGSSPKTVNPPGLTAPVDVGVLGDDLLIAQQNGTIARHPLTSLS